MIMLLISTYKSFCIASRCFDFKSGGCAAAPFFLLLAQKKEGKEKGTLLSPDRCAPCPITARKELTADAAQTPFRFIRGRLRCSLAIEGMQG